MSRANDRWHIMLWCVLGVSVPLSVKLYLPGLGTEVIFPAEPLLAVLVLSLLIRSIRSHRPLKGELYRSEVVLGITWLMILAGSALFSQMPLTSWKVLVVQTTYVSAFLLLPAVLGEHNGSKGALRWHDRAFLLVVAWTLISQTLSGFDRSGANHAAYPFYMDHTIYSAVLTFVFFRQLVAALQNQYASKSSSRKLFHWLLSALLLIALVLSFGRAAWSGLAVALVGASLLRTKIPWYALVLLITTLAITTYTLRTPVIAWLKEQEAASQEQGAGVAATVRSMVNITSDTSNHDRVLRWKQAWRMFAERPLMGHGPGTYQFLGQQYMLDSERSSLHANWLVPDERQVPAWKVGNALWLRDHAQRSPSSGGTAHSEYLLSLSELGVLGGLWWLALVLLVASRVQRIFQDRKGLRTWGAQHAAALALMAYLTHALFNNFLDDCKVALLFWTALAVLMERPAHKVG